MSERSPRLTRRLLHAIDSAVTAMLAGQEGEGDWPEDLPAKDLEDASYWIYVQLQKRNKNMSG